MTLDDTQRRILEFLARHAPYETYPAVYEQRIVVCGELRLALHEYDAACGGLFAQGLISTDPPYASDCDSIALTTSGRRAVSRPLQPGGPSQRLLQFLAQAAPAESEAGWMTMEDLLAAAGLALQPGGAQAYQKACQELYNQGWIERQRQGANWYAAVRLTRPGRAAGLS